MKKKMFAGLVMVLCLIGIGNITEAATTPVIMANGVEEAVNITSEDNLLVTIGLDTGGLNTDADWWILCENGGNWFSYIFPSGWSSGINLCCQTALIDFSSYSIFDHVLPPGTYTFYFGVDLNPDGVIDLPLYYDSVVVTIEEPTHDSNDISGAYKITNTVDATNCGEGVYTYSAIFNVTQNGNNISVSGNDYDGDPFVLTGTLNGNSLSISGSYSEDGGTTNMTANLTVSGNSFSGSITWTWASTYFSCSGSDTISGVKQ